MTFLMLWGLGSACVMLGYVLRVLMERSMTDDEYELIAVRAATMRYLHGGRDKWWLPPHDRDQCSACRAMRELDMDAPIQIDRTE